MVIRTSNLVGAVNIYSNPVRNFSPRLFPSIFSSNRPPMCDSQYSLFEEWRLIVHSGFWFVTENHFSINYFHSHMYSIVAPLACITAHNKNWISSMELGHHMAVLNAIAHCSWNIKRNNGLIKCTITNFFLNKTLFSQL